MDRSDHESALLDRHQVHAVVEMPVVQLLSASVRTNATQHCRSSDAVTHPPVNEEIQHAVTLRTQLQTGSPAARMRGLEEIRRFELAGKVHLKLNVQSLQGIMI